MNKNAYLFSTGFMKERTENTPKAIALAEAKAARVDAKAEAKRRRVEEKAQWKIARQEAEQRAREVLKSHDDAQHTYFTCGFKVSTSLFYVMVCCLSPL